MKVNKGTISQNTYRATKKSNYRTQLTNEFLPLVRPNLIGATDYPRISKGTFN